MILAIVSAVLLILFIGFKRCFLRTQESQEKRDKNSHLYIFDKKTNQVTSMVMPSKLPLKDKIYLPKLGASIVMYSENIAFIVELTPGGPLLKAGAKIYDILGAICPMPIHDRDKKQGIVNHKTILINIHSKIKANDHLVVVVIRDFDRKRERLIELKVSA